MLPRPRPRCRQALVSASVLLCALALASCGGEGAASPSPLPSVPGSANPLPARDTEAWGGLSRDGRVLFGSGGASADVVLRAEHGQWRDAVVGTDGTQHRNVLAVDLRVTCSRSVAAPLSLRAQGWLRLADGRSRRSGTFAAAGQLGPVEPGATRRGWLLFENVDWDALRGDSQPPSSRLEVTLPLGGTAQGTGVWMVDAWGPQEGAVRRVTVPVLSAHVTYLVM